MFRVCLPGSSERCEKPLSNSCFSLCYCCHEEGQGKLLTEHIYIFKDIFRLDMEQVLSWHPSCRHLRTFFFSHPALTVKEGHG